MSLLPVGIGSAVGGYQIERSLRFNSADSANLSKSFTATSSCTFSFWVKRANLGSEQYLFWCDGGSGNHWGLRYDGDDKFTIFKTQGGSDTSTTTTAVYRDVGGWYHVVVNGTPTLYINGVQAVTGSYTWAHIGGTAYIGRRNSTYLNAYLTEFHYIDGSNLTPSSFGETNTDTGVWKPKAYSGSYGTNGFYLKFADNSGTTSTTLGKDSSGNGNNWTPNNFSVTAGAGNDSLVDTPTNYGTDTGVGGEVRGNYCTMNPLQYSSTYATLSNGNLNVSGASSADAGGAFATARVNSGKWYWEALILGTQSSYPFLGFAVNATGTNFVGGARIGTAGTPEIVSPESFIALNGSPSGTSFTTNDVIQFALDMDNGKMWVGKNGTWMNSGVPASGTGNMFSISDTSQFVSPYIFSYNASSVAFNFGQRAFSYTAPSGFKALCTQNLPEPTIKDGGEYFNTVLYTGNGSTQSITGVGFQPDWVWIKSRSNAVAGPLFDVLRGTTKGLFPNLTNAEFTDATTLTAFNSDGFTVAGNTHTNLNTYTYVAWNWKANGAGSTNTAGTITSTVSVNTTSGFSIVTYTGNGTAGATVGHGLGVTPALIIVKRRDGGTNSWNVQHQSVNYNSVLFLDLTSAATVNSNFNSTGPTSSVFYLGSSDGTNGSGGTKTYVAYCFAPVAGYSAFGSYTGNGSSTDGPFIYTGFRPRYVLIKSSSNISNWIIFDSARGTYNVNGPYLYANGSDAEGTSTTVGLDFLSNGFKHRNDYGDANTSSRTYIYMALAENPFKYSLAR